jgi:hypothetical protein
VVVLEDGEVERKMKQESDDMEVLAMGQFLIGNGCRRQLMGSYMDVGGVGCREIGAVNYNQYGEGEDGWLQERERWARK